MLAEKRVDEAFDDARLSWFLAALSAGDRNLLGGALQPIWEGLADHRWSAVQLTEFEASLARVDLLSEYAPALRRSLLQELVFWEKRRDEPRRGWWRLTRILSPVGWTYQYEVALCRFYGEQLRPTVDPVRQRVYPERQQKAFVVWQRLGLFTRTGGEPPLGLSWQLARVQTGINLARVACALERYRIGHGEYPAKLVDLVDGKYLERLPHDLVDGGPLRYRRPRGDHFVLYSVGSNSVDDGGRSRGEADWVWEYPP